MADLVTGIDLPNPTIPLDDFSARTKINNPEIKKAFGYALNAIHNGWDSSVRLEKTTAALLEEVGKSKKLSPEQKSDLETVQNVQDPRVKYQMALELNRSIDGKLYAGIFAQKPVEYASVKSNESNPPVEVNPGINFPTPKTEDVPSSETQLTSTKPRNCRWESWDKGVKAGVFFSAMGGWAGLGVAKGLGALLVPAAGTTLLPAVAIIGIPVLVGAVGGYLVYRHYVGEPAEKACEASLKQP